MVCRAIVAAAYVMGLILAPAALAAGGAAVSIAQAEIGPETKLPLPRFVSLNASRINVRRGPGLDYRIDWVFRRHGLPVRVIDEYEGWRRIRDQEGEDGWVFHALISGRRTVIVTAPGALLRNRPEGAPYGRACEASNPLPSGVSACAQNGVVAILEACEADWCRIETDGHSGWVPKLAIWGVESGEVFDD